MTREDFVLVYKDKGTTTTYCRICMFIDVHSCQDMMFSNNNRCCCRDFQEANDDWIKFNNQKAIPLVFSDGRCFLNIHGICRKSDCCGRITECDFII